MIIPRKQLGKCHPLAKRVTRLQNPKITTASSTYSEGPGGTTQEWRLKRFPFPKAYHVVAIKPSFTVKQRTYYEYFRLEQRIFCILDSGILDRDP